MITTTQKTYNSNYQIGKIGTLWRKFKNLNNENNKNKSMDGS